MEYRYEKMKKKIDHYFDSGQFLRDIEIANREEAKKRDRYIRLTTCTTKEFARFMDKVLKDVNSNLANLFIDACIEFGKNLNDPTELYPPSMNYEFRGYSFHSSLGPCTLPVTIEKITNEIL